MSMTRRNGQPGGHPCSPHCPPQQLWLLPQAVPHVPQLVGSSWRSMHVPAQQLDFSAGQTLPQLPQFLGSLRRSTQTQSQLTNPGVAQAGAVAARSQEICATKASVPPPELPWAPPLVPGPLVVLLLLAKSVDVVSPTTYTSPVASR